jgi:hypothetical protein
MPTICFRGEGLRSREESGAGGQGFLTEDALGPEVREENLARNGRGDVWEAGRIPGERQGVSQ